MSNGGRYCLEKAGASPASPHVLRHAFAMALYRRTRDVLLVRRALGHRSIGSSSGDVSSTRRGTTW